MDEIEVVIKIPKGYKKLIDDIFGNNGLLPYVISKDLLGAVSLGIVLPKGHGRLVDADAILEDPFGNTYKDIDVAETVIEADREVENK